MDSPKAETKIETKITLDHTEKLVQKKRASLRVVFTVFLFLSTCGKASHSESLKRCKCDHCDALKVASLLLGLILCLIRNVNVHLISTSGLNSRHAVYSFAVISMILYARSLKFCLVASVCLSVSRFCRIHA